MGGEAGAGQCEKDPRCVRGWRHTHADWNIDPSTHARPYCKLRGTMYTIEYLSTILCTTTGIHTGRRSGAEVAIRDPRKRYVTYLFEISKGILRTPH